jgi:hypothetical protein
MLAYYVIWRWKPNSPNARKETMPTGEQVGLKTAEVEMAM